MFSHDSGLVIWDESSIRDPSELETAFNWGTRKI
jgi:hypothetical protein